MARKTSKANTANTRSARQRGRYATGGIRMYFIQYGSNDNEVAHVVDTLARKQTPDLSDETHVLVGNLVAGLQQRYRALPEHERIAVVSGIAVREKVRELESLFDTSTRHVTLESDPDGMSASCVCTDPEGMLAWLNHLATCDEQEQVVGKVALAVLMQHGASPDA